MTYSDQDGREMRSNIQIFSEYLRAFVVSVFSVSSNYCGEEYRQMFSMNKFLSTRAINE